MLGRVLPEEAGAVRKSVRVVPLPSREDDAVDVRRYVSTLLVAQSDKPWPSRRTTHQALDQAENWLSPLRAEADAQRLADRRLGDLAPLERRLVTLSAAAVQSPELIVVAEPIETSIRVPCPGSRGSAPSWCTTPGRSCCWSGRR